MRLARRGAEGIAVNIDDKDRGVGPAPGWKESLWWAVLHDAVAHPVMALSGYSQWAIRFHQWTGKRAWKPRHNVGPML